MRAKWVMLVAGGALFAAAFLQLGQQSGQAQSGASTAPGDWPLYSRDAASTRYSPLTEVNRQNVANLRLAWTFQPEAPAPAAGKGGGKGKAKGKGKGRGGAGRVNAELTPIAVDGVLYVAGGNRVFAVDGDTGEEIWTYTAPGNVANRAVGYWPGDGQNPPRVLFTTDEDMIAVNANTGSIDPGFGEEGMVEIGVNWGGAPYVYKNLIFLGNNNGESTGEAPPGDTRVYSAQTGEHLWNFKAVAQPGTPEGKTWGPQGWTGAGVNVWGWYMTVDEERDLIYMPFGSPAGNYWGGDRPGSNLYANSLVAVDANTGEYRWHFQVVHHDLWDTDLPAAPALIDIHRDGQTIPALAVTGKHALMFILNRETGEPIYGVEERAVPQGSVPGEWYSPTQPFPLKPKQLARNSFTPDDLVTAEDTTPEHAAACLELFQRGNYYNEGPYTPFPFHKAGDPPRSALQFPGNGGPNWGGEAADPTTGYVYISTHDSALSGWVEKKVEGGNYGSGNGSPQPYDRGSITGPGPYSGFSAMGMPCQKPPWGRLFAVDANTGDVAWEIVLGLNERLPEGKQLVGAVGSAGPSVTAGGLVFAPANDQRLRALDSRSGRELWQGLLDASMNANPMIYAGKSGKEYVAGVAGGAVVAFALP